MRKTISTKISVQEQETLFHRCIAEKLDLQKIIDELQIGYEDFKYKNYKPLKILNHPSEWLEDIGIVPNEIPTISFFAGAGGFDIGLEYAGFNTLATFEINELFCNTLQHNFPKKQIFNIDLRERASVYTILKEKVGINTPFEGIFHGGPPCQSFSIAANQRFSKEGENFKRVGFEHVEYGNLLADYIWYIQQFKPKVFIIENVPGLFEMDHGKQLFEMLGQLAATGYTISPPQIVNLADHGVPQNRRRLFVVGSRSLNAFVFPKAIPQKVPCYHVFEKSLEGVANHETRLHKADSLIRYMQLDYGQRDQLGRVDRLDPQLPSKTVIAGGVKGGGRSHLHPYIPRTLSVRESARLQTFPDKYVFTGPIARQFTQVGNAVPPLFAYKMGVQIYQQFYTTLSIVNTKWFIGQLFPEFAQVAS